MPRLAANLILWAGLGLAVLFGGTSQARADDEIDAHLVTLRSQVEDPKLAIAQREELALEMARTLDRAAQTAATAEGQRDRWSLAIDLLDRFHEQNPGQPRARQFLTQSAVYRWARARSWAGHWKLAPTDLKARQRAVEDLDAAITTLRSVVEGLGTASDVFAENGRFRLAQALTDRAEFDAEGSEPRRAREREALGLLERPVKEPALQGFAALLHGELLGRQNRFESALAAFQEAAKARPGVPAADLIEARAAILIGLKRFDEARRAIETASVDESVKDLLTVRTFLAMRTDAAPGEARSKIEAELFRRIQGLRATGKPEAARAMLALARSVAEPGASESPEAWDALAEGCVRLGELDRASALEIKGAERAEALGDHARSAALRLRAGAFLFQAEKYVEADPLLTQVADDRKAGESRSRAALLRSLARGRALATRRPGASLSGYAAALEAQIRDFPREPSTSEARWLLGKLRLAKADRDKALALWSAIPHGDPRWLEARLAVARLRQEDLDNQRLNNDREQVARRYEDVRQLLVTSLEQARGDVEKAELNLMLARLELTPEAGHLDQARLICELIHRSASQAEQRDRAQRLAIVATAQLGRFVEAEQAARAEAKTARPDDLLEMARLLDHAASETESDLRMRRFGFLVRILIGPVLERLDALTPTQRAEARLRQTRALLFSGDERAARQSIGTWSNPTTTADDSLLRDLADVYARLDAHELAVDVQRLRSRQLVSGSLAWFEARYGLALALYRSGKSEEGRHLIDATAILHPDLGGGELREKFERLRQRLNPE